MKVAPGKLLDELSRHSGIFQPHSIESEHVLGCEFLRLIATQHAQFHPILSRVRRVYAQICAAQGLFVVITFPTLLHTPSVALTG